MIRDQKAERPQGVAVLGSIAMPSGHAPARRGVPRRRGSDLVTSATIYAAALVVTAGHVIASVVDAVLGMDQRARTARRRFSPASLPVRRTEGARFGHRPRR